MKREDVESILPFLPLVWSSGTLCWPAAVEEAIRELSMGPAHSGVNSSNRLTAFIRRVRALLAYPTLSKSTYNGYQLCLNRMYRAAAAAQLLNIIVPQLAVLLLKFPILLKKHYADVVVGEVNTGLRLLEPQQPGIVFLSQELIAALLACAFFCLFPSNERDAKNLPTVNFDGLFSYLFDSNEIYITHKIGCIAHYFQRICHDMPDGMVSFQKKVIPFRHSGINLSPNNYFGGDVLHQGCEQEEILFINNPELIAGRLFLTGMKYNESIEVVGAEQFTYCEGYGESLQAPSECLVQKNRDSDNRRETLIVVVYG